MDPIQVIILAAGNRINSGVPDVLIPIDTIPMIIRILTTLIDSQLCLRKLIIVVRPEEKELIKKECTRYMPSILRHDIVWVEQIPHIDGNGTGGAVRSVVRANIIDNKYNILILNGDSPMIEGTSLEGFVRSMKKTNEMMFGTVFVKDVVGFGRVLRERNTRLRIIEQNQIDQLQPDHPWRALHEINSGVYIVKAPFLTSKAKDIKEEKLTELLSMSDNIDVYPLFKEIECVNINTVLDKNYAEYIISQRQRDTMQRSFMTLLHKRI